MEEFNNIINIISVCIIILLIVVFIHRINKKQLRLTNILPEKYIKIS